VCHLYLGGPQGVGFHEVQSVHGTRAQHKRSQVPHGTGDLGWQEYQVILQRQSRGQARQYITAQHTQNALRQCICSKERGKTCMQRDGHTQMLPPCRSTQKPPQSKRKRPNWCKMTRMTGKVWQVGRLGHPLGERTLQMGTISTEKVYL